MYYSIWKLYNSGTDQKTEAIKIIYHQGQSSEHINEYVDLSASLLDFFTYETSAFEPSIKKKEWHN